MTQLAEATLPTAGKTIDHLLNTADGLEDIIIVMGHPDIVPGAGDLLSHKFRPIISHCHHGFATTMTGYTADRLRVSVMTHRMRTGSTEVFTCDIITLKCTDVRDQHAKGAGYCVCQHHPCRDVRHPPVLNADNFYDALVSENVLELEESSKKGMTALSPTITASRARSGRTLWSRTRQSLTGSSRSRSGLNWTTMSESPPLPLVALSRKNATTSRRTP